MLRSVSKLRCVAIAIAASVSMQPALCAAQARAPASAAIHSVSDGDADDESRELAEALTGLMRQMTGLEIVDAAKVREVAAYSCPPAGGGEGDISSLIAGAKESHFGFRRREAQERIDGAIAALSGRRLDSETGPLALDAYLTKAMIASSAGDDVGLGEALSGALAVDPLLDLSGRDYPPSLIGRLDSIRAERAGAPSGSLAVRSRPAGAEVSLNGISRGATPLVIAALPAGSYSLTISANRYVDDSRDIYVASGETLKIRGRLRWRRGREGGKGAGGPDELASGLSLASALRVDRVVIVDADAAERGATGVRARVVDGELRAGLRPLVIESVDPEYRYDQLAEMAERLASQLAVDPLADPAGSLDAIGDADPIVLGRRKKQLSRQPLFWGAIGVAAAGALIGGILAAMSSGGSDRGSLKVSFK